MPFPFRRPCESVGCVEIPVAGTTSNVFVLGAPDAAVLVDCGSADSADGVIATLQRQGVRPGGVRALVVTHGHYDHYGGAGALADWSGAEVWAHLATAAPMEDHRADFFSLAFWGPNASADDWRRFQAAAGREVRVARILREGDRIDHAGLRLDVLHMPGHQRGAISLFEPTRRLAFVGDLIQGGVDASGNWLGLYHDMDAQRRSLRRLAELDPDWLFRGHRGPRHGRDELVADVESALRRLDDIERAVLAALEPGQPITAADATRAAFAALFGVRAEQAPNYAVASVAACLLDLAQRGLASRTADLLWQATEKETKEPPGPK